MAAGVRIGFVAGAALIAAACGTTAPQGAGEARGAVAGHAPQAREAVAELARAGVIDLSRDGSPIVAHWRPVDDTAAPRPAVVALHGCGGLYRRDGRIFDSRYLRYVDRLHRAGYHVLLPDSFTPRGSASICTVKNGARTIRVETRRADVVAAVHWLARQPNVDPQRIAVLGWSHGAMTTLNAINSARPGYAAPLAGAVVFYPGCNALLHAPFKIEIPVLMLLGEKDDWTPPARCEALADRTHAEHPEADLTLRVYPDSYHGFDGTAPVRYWTDVSNGVDPAGVHLGANPAARAQAQAQMDQFLARVLK